VIFGFTFIVLLTAQAKKDLNTATFSNKTCKESGPREDSQFELQPLNQIQVGGQPAFGFDLDKLAQ